VGGGSFCFLQNICQCLRSLSLQVCVGPGPQGMAGLVLSGDLYGISDFTYHISATSNFQTHLATGVPVLQGMQVPKAGCPHHPCSHPSPRMHFLPAALGVCSQPLPFFSSPVLPSRWPASSWEKRHLGLNPSTSAWPATYQVLAKCCLNEFTREIGKR
jgi:hypothetical protein